MPLARMIRISYIRENNAKITTMAKSSPPEEYIHLRVKWLSIQEQTYQSEQDERSMLLTAYIVAFAGNE